MNFGSQTMDKVMAPTAAAFRDASAERTSPAKTGGSSGLAFLLAKNLLFWGSAAITLAVLYQAGAALLG